MEQRKEATAHETSVPDFQHSTLLGVLGRLIEPYYPGPGTSASMGQMLWQVLELVQIVDSQSAEQDWNPDLLGP